MTTFTNVFGGDTVPPSQYQYRAVTLSTVEDFYFPMTSDGPNLLASIMDVSAPDIDMGMTFPDATNASVGYDVLVRNVGAETFTLYDNAGGSIATVDPSQAKYVYLSDNSTAAGVWQVFTFGTGTSSADASLLAGEGLTVNGPYLALSIATSTLSGDITVDPGSLATAIVFTGGSVTCDLPVLTDIENGWYFDVRNSGTGSVTVDTLDGALIDGAATKILAPDESATFVTDGSQWHSLGFGRSAEFVFTKLVLDISGGGTIALTSAQASNKLLQFVGTAPGNVTVEVPTVVSIYYTQCSYSGAFTLTLTTALGSGIALNNSDRIIAYCDGVDVVSAQSVSASTAVSLTDGSAANPSLYFSADTDTGLYRAGTNTLGIAAGGIAALTISNTVGTPLVKWNFVSGTAGAPTLYFNGESSTGFYRKAANTIGFSTSGTERGFIDSTGINTPIGGTTAYAGSFTTITASSTINATGTITATGGFIGALTGTADNSLALGGVAAASYALLASPVFTGDPTAPTPAYGDSDTSIATTAYGQANFVAKSSQTGSAKTPTGTTAQRDGTPAAGYLRFNSDTGKFEGYDGSTWNPIAEVSKVGELFDWPFADTPAYGLLCDGSAVSSTTYVELFAKSVKTSTVTMTIASPCVVTWTSHPLYVNAPIKFTTTGALPTGITAGTTYYVISSGFGINSFQISASIGGAAINTSGTQSGVHTGIHAPYGCANDLSTFNVPDIPADYTTVQSDANEGTVSIGEVISHNHTAVGSFARLISGGGNLVGGSAINYTPVTINSTGGAANLAAGLSVRKCIRFE